MAGIFAANLNSSCWDVLKRAIRHLQPLRGDKHAGFAVLGGQEIHLGKCEGTAESLFKEKEAALPKIKEGQLAIGAASFQDTQPILVEESILGPFALAGDVKIVNQAELRHKYPTLIGSDIRICAGLIAGASDPVDGLKQVFEDVRGRFNLILLTHDGLFACRDARGFRSLAIGRSKEGCCAVASESSALGAGFGETEVELIREVRPGEIIQVEDTGFKPVAQVPSSGLVMCSFDITYGQGPASIFEGVPVHKGRFNMGRKLAQRWPVEAEICFPFPLSGNAVCEGWCLESGIPLVNVWQYIPLIGRSYLPPTEEERRERGRAKLSPVAWILQEFKSIVGLDDSIVEGNQLLARISLLHWRMKQYHNGEGEIHLRISCPPKVKGCPLDVPAHPTEKLFARDRDKETMRRELRLKSLEFNSLDDYLEAILRAQSEERKGSPLMLENLCQCCFTGEELTEKYLK